MVTITNPAMLSFKMGEAKYSIFKKIPFLIAYWKEKNDFPKEFVDLIQLSANRMDFASTDMLPKDRKNKFVYFSVYTSNIDGMYEMSIDPNVGLDRTFICYVGVRAKDIVTLSKYSTLLIGDMHKVDMKSIYRLPIDACNKAKSVSRAIDAGEFWVAYETLKSGLISALVNYEDIFE